MTFFYDMYNDSIGFVASVCNIISRTVHETTIVVTEATCALAVIFILFWLLPTLAHIGIAVSLWLLGAPMWFVFAFFAA